LKVVHLEGFPDYVACSSCGSQFVMEDGGERAMYGSIPEQYPETKRFALRQWAWLEAIEHKAKSERPPKEMSAAPSEDEIPPGEDETSPVVEGEVSLWEHETPAEIVPPSDPSADEGAVPILEHEPPAEDEAIFPLGEDEAPAAAEGGVPLWEDDSPVDEEQIEHLKDDLLQRTPIDLKTIGAEPTPIPETEPEAEVAKTPELEPTYPEPEVSSIPSMEDGEIREQIGERAAEPEPEIPIEPEQQEEDSESIEPEPGKRFRIVLRSPEATIPYGLCAHCLRSPAQQKLVIVGSTDDSAAVDRPNTYALPLCSRCHRRARARSDDERNARLTAYLGAGLGAAIVVVASLALGLVNFRENLITDLLILGILGILGFAIPAWFLLGRTARYAPARDAIFVRSTLAIPESGEDVHTAFEWRNQGFAQRFMEANYQALIGDLTEVQDWLDLEPSSEE
jgi:hypothetical protein